MNDWLKRTLKILPIHIAVVLMIFVGCAGSPLAISLMSAGELKNVSDQQLCAAYAYSKSKKVKAELEARDLFDDREWRAIQQGNVFVGMSKNAMLAAYQFRMDVRAPQRNKNLILPSFSFSSPSSERLCATDGVAHPFFEK